MAEGIFLHQVKTRGLEKKYEADSAGTGDWHIGHGADARTIAAGRKNGVPVPSIARQVKLSDFENFDLIVAMDRANQADLESLSAKVPAASIKAKIILMRQFDPEVNPQTNFIPEISISQNPGKYNVPQPSRSKNLDVPDPYYGGPEDFDRVFEILDRSCKQFMEELEKTYLF